MERQRFRAIDSHTGGEPTRLVVEGAPEWPGLSMDHCRQRLKKEADFYRTMLTREPRGSEVMVGGVLFPPADPKHTAGVVFFNNVGYLGMCGHGAIGLMATLRWLGRIEPGVHRLETPVGIVTCEVSDGGAVAIENVPSHREVKGLVVEVPGLGPITGDVAWGGNWFFLTSSLPGPYHLSEARYWTDVAQRIGQAVREAGYSQVDHVELCGQAVDPGGNGRNFVLCPGLQYDRSPCGTGTSAKLACLAADGDLVEGDRWVQESILGSRFEGSFRWLDRQRGVILPKIVGRAFIMADVTVVADPEDRWSLGF